MTKMDTLRMLFLKLTFVLIFSNISFSATYTMGTSGSQSATITATSGSPDKFYDNGGSGSNYSSSVSSTYTFNCAAGKYVRIKLNSLSSESGIDLFYVYDGTSTSSRLIGEDSQSGTISTGYMYVATSGSLTIKFTSDGSLEYDGWDVDVWIDDYAGQVWDGSTSTEITNATNWEGNVLPYDGFSSIYIPSGLSNYPILSDASSQQMSFYDFRVSSGASYYFSSANNVMSIYGNAFVDGVFNKTSTLYVNFEGGNSSNYATISGSGDFSTVSVGVGLNRVAYYKILNSLTIKSFKLNNVNGASCFDMNFFDFKTLSFTAQSSTTFYQRSGELRIEGSTISINDVAFVESIGTTNFASGNNWAATNQTIPSVQFYNLKISTNNGYTVTMGAGSTLTILNDLTIKNPSTAGGVVTNPNDVTVGGDFYLGATGNALTLNLANRVYRASGTGTFTMGNVSGHAINNTYASASNYVISGFDATPIFYGTFTYNSGSSQKVIPASYYNLISTGSGTKTMYGDITVSNDITFSNGNYVQGVYNMNVSGNWTSTGNYYTEGTGLVTFDGSGTSTITGASSTIGGASGSVIYSDACESSTNWTLNGGTANWALTTPSGTFSPTSDNSASGTKCFKTETSGTAYQSTKTYILTSPTIDLTGYTNCSLSFYLWMNNEGSASVYDGGFIEVYNGTSWVSATGSLAYDGTISSSFSNPYAGSSAWTYDHTTWTKVTVNIAAYSGISNFKIRFKYGSDSSTGDGGWAVDDLNVTGDITGEAYAGEAFNSVDVNKTGAGNVVLGSKIFLQTNMTFTSGIVTSTASFYPEFDEDANVATASNASHVNGYVAKRTNTTTKFTFPVGDGSKYRLASVTPSSTSATTWTTKYFNSAYSDLSLSDITSVSNVEYWTIDRSGAANSTVELSWDASSGVTSLTNFVVAHYNGADWEDAGNSSYSGTTSAGLISSNVDWSSYSPFTISVNAPIVLPIELISFKGEKYNEKEILLTWITASEINNDYFTIERSFDGYHFSPLTRVDGAGNSIHQIDYHFVDTDPINGINYYKLIQTDFDGKEIIAKIISVDMTKKVITIIKTVNSIGQEVKESYSGVVFDIFSDGSSVKRMQ